MFADPGRYRCVLEAVDKMNVEIHYYWLTNRHIDVYAYMPNEEYDYIVYSRGIWYGHTDRNMKIAVFKGFDDTKVPFKEFVKLVDIRHTVMSGDLGKFVNNYETILIFSYYNPVYLYYGISSAKINKLKSWIHFHTLE